uniref:Jacalin-type lectin domain-containing protein n=1 Tax=Favella ehrenbergii TaxID=182087 RepID=A0A7S3HZE1_9SPIT|mmetsp:Transcript_29317/g.39029  ORF Transcript_29317/g.39029 Transcript_29317/m.39029 type:complete len:102 (+) Transcript_29317:1197-1502(+)|eukprot:CAMPEP_0185614280 /NCGR_PEP_ID=MMETSP0436-20130131/30976_1 /TAXON_ID=626734 ORGANISM="Favella taraikaensis, Strain Fe Narragansett Bay" /NCGR_SAMPLE_ID=MMETSP0436 /ASSEMBLY_ACC=CAM_ASM_000390 /LENGTH=101 /DNA_ID=CAMNT_0028248959 /DNA_START=747 /DNA_END=1052 /DNA_ORIENTATION=-
MTEEFGKMSTGQQLKCSLEVPVDEKITGIRVRHNPNACQIQNITFDTNEGTEIEFNGKQNTGSWRQFSLSPGQLVVGCYGSYGSEDREAIVGLGFIVWTPM